MDKLISITENLVIRKFTLDDANTYFQNNNEAQVRATMPDHSHESFEEAYREIKEFLLCYDEMKMPYHFAITKNDILIGHVGIGESEIKAGAYEICCAINNKHRGCGFAVEASKAFIQWCESTFKLDEIYASTGKENIASNKALLKAGFVLNDVENNLYVNNLKYSSKEKTK